MKQDSSIAELAELLRTEAARLGPGARLPSSRELVARHRVSPVTVSRALAQLAGEGAVVTRPGSGTFVAPRRRPVHDTADLSWQTVALGDRTIDDSTVSALLSPPPEGVIPLSGGYLHRDLQPTAALTAAAARAVRRPGGWERPPLSGVIELRRWFARQAGGTVAEQDVLVVSGGQAGLAIAFRALAAPGSAVLVEAPTYPGALASARAAGLRPVPVPMDGEGVLPDLLAEAFAETGARLFYTQPTLHNPTGAILPRRRREQVLAVARAAGAFVVEDDYCRHLGLEALPPPLIAHDDHGVVVHLTSLSKITAPSLRVGAVIARGPAAHRLRAAYLVDAFFVARPLQETALELVGSPAWRRHLVAVRAELRQRRDVLAAELTRWAPAAEVAGVPDGGLHLWLRLPGEVDDTTIAEAALRHGVLVNPGRPHYAAEPPGPRLRVTHAAAANLAELGEGVRRLARALETLY